MLNLDPLMRILIVEGEKKLADLMCRALRAERYAVDLAEDGSAAWQVLGRNGFDLVILDLMMSEVHGDDILRRIRRTNESLPVLIVSARDETKDRIRAFQAGADDFLGRPFAFAELILRVRALLRRGPISRCSVLRVGDLEIDRLTQRVRRAGRRIDLTVKEYALLEYLASNPGCIFSRTAIIKNVWDQSFEGLTNIVDVYVSHLRGKVDDPFPTKLIRTVRGAGYSIGEAPP